MFEIMRALLDLQAACEKHGTSLYWDIRDEPGTGLHLNVEIPVTEDDQRFVQEMTHLLAPKENSW